MKGQLFKRKHIFRLNLYSSAFLLGCHDVLQIFLSLLLTVCKIELLILKYLQCQLISLTDNKETDNYTVAVLSPTQSSKLALTCEPWHPQTAPGLEWH